MHYETFFQRLQPDARVLDVGCGDGRLTVQIAQHVPSGFVLGVDNCYQTLVHTKVSQIGAEFPNLKFVQADARRLRLGQEPFDYVLSKGCLHYLEHPGQAFAAMARNLRPGGTMYCWCLGRGNAERINTVFRRLSKAEQWKSYLTGWRLPWGHACPESCRPWLHKAGLALVEGLLMEEELLLADRGVLLAWFRRSWCGYRTRIPHTLIEVFEAQLLDAYLSANHGRCSVQRTWLVLEACKSGPGSNKILEADYERASR